MPALKNNRKARKRFHPIFILAIALLFASAWTKGDEPTRWNAAAPELTGGPWLNTPKHAPITLASRRGKVTIVEFWTFG